MSHARDAVSVVIPFFGRTRLTEEALRSAVAQQGVAVELVVVDDGSAERTDRLQCMVRALGGTYIRQPHHGIARARNAGIAAATSRWIAFLDSDDLFYPQKLARQLRAMGRFGAQWSCCGFDLATRDGRVTERSTLKSVQEGFWRVSCPFGATSLVVERDLVRRAGGFDETFDRCEDWDFVYRLGSIAPPTVVRESLYAYRIGVGNVTSYGAASWFASWRQLTEKRGVTIALDSYPGLRNLMPLFAEYLQHGSCATR